MPNPLVMTPVLGHRLMRAHDRDAGRNIVSPLTLFCLLCGQQRCTSTGGPVAKEMWYKLMCECEQAGAVPSFFPLVNCPQFLLHMWLSLQKRSSHVVSFYHPSMVAEHGCLGDEAETVDVAVPQILEGIVEESLKGDLAETKRSLADETLAAKLAEKRDRQPPEWEERRRNKAEEILAIHEAIKLMNNDDALQIFKATLTSSPLVQVLQSTIAVARRAIDEPLWSSGMLGNSVSNLNLISVPLNDKSVDLSKVISVIDETVILLKAEQGEDHCKKAYCTEGLGQTLATGMRSLTTRISCPALVREFRSASLNRHLMSLFRK